MTHWRHLRRGKSFLGAPVPRVGYKARLDELLRLTDGLRLLLRGRGHLRVAPPHPSPPHSYVTSLRECTAGTAPSVQHPGLHGQWNIHTASKLAFPV